MIGEHDTQTRDAKGKHLITMQQINKIQALLHVGCYYDSELKFLDADLTFRMTY